MNIPHRARTIILAGAAIVGLSASLAFAATTTWTVSPGGTDNSSAGTVTLRDNVTGNTLRCTSSHSTNSVKSGHGLPGADIASVTAISFSGCTITATGQSITVTPSGSWSLNAESFNSSTGVTTGTITNVRAAISGSGCGATVSGTADGTYSDSTGVVQVSSGGSLAFSSVSGCSGLIRNGDSATFTGSYTASPKQTVTSP